MSRTTASIVLLSLLTSSITFVSITSSIAVASGLDEQPIVGGTRAPKGKWPDTVAVLMRGGACSGTLVAPDVVVTAGHCIDAEPYEVVLDTTDYGRTGGERIAVKWSRAYPDWETRYDVGVIMLERPSTVAPRTVAAACTMRDGLEMFRKVHLVGFGLTRETAQSNTVLHEATVAITDPTCTRDPSCQASIAPHGEFMAGGGGADSCFGDSGGPVYLDLPGGPALIGIVSRGLTLAPTPCGGGGIYVRADKVVSWIQRVTDRKLLRTTCGGKGDDEVSMEEGGCHAGGSVDLGVAFVVGAIVIRRRRRKPAR